MSKLNWFDWIVAILVIIGGLNWGLVGFFNWNLVEAIFGMGTTAAMVVYDIVGLAALYMIFVVKKTGKSSPMM